MIGSSKNNRENYPRKFFWTKEKETRVKRQSAFEQLGPGTNAVILHNFWRPQPTLPCFRLQYSISKNTRTTVSLSLMQEAFAESSLRKQAWRNPKEGRVVCLHQNIFTRKVTHLPPTFAIIIHIPRPLRPCIWRPRVPYLMSSSPSSRVPKSQVPTHASRCPRPLVPVPLLYTAFKLIWKNEQIIQECILCYSPCHKAYLK